MFNCDTGAWIGKIEFFPCYSGACCLYRAPAGSLPGDMQSPPADVYPQAAYHPRSPTYFQVLCPECAAVVDRPSMTSEHIKQLQAGITHDLKVTIYHITSYWRHILSIYPQSNIHQVRYPPGIGNLAGYRHVQWWSILGIHIHAYTYVHTYIFLNICVGAVKRICSLMLLQRSFFSNILTKDTP